MVRRLAVIFLTFAAAVGLWGGLVQPVHAVLLKEPPPITFSPEITIPTFAPGGSVTITNTTIAEYIRSIFIYFIWSVGILATIVIVYGGIKWVAAAGNPSRITDARDIINNAIIGIIIALTSVLLLNTIDKRLTAFPGIVVKGVSQDILNLEKEIIAQTQDVQITNCSATSVQGEPSMCCTKGGDCSNDDQLNTWINNSAKQYGVDPFIVKAIMNQESRLNGRLVSRSTGVKMSDGRWGSAYGLGQFIAATLYEQLKKVRGGLPSECGDPKRQQGGATSGQLNQTCQKWMDDNMDVQVQLVAHFLSELQNAKCIAGNQKLMALGYYIGVGGAVKFCLNETTPDEPIPDSKTAAGAANYVRQVGNYYSNFCQLSGGVST